MSLSSVITLKDRYTGTADKVAKSSQRMGKSMTSSAKQADSLTSSLKKMTQRSYNIKMKDIKDKKIKGQLQSLQSELKKTTGKNHQVKITVKKSLKELTKSNLELFKNKAVNIKMNASGLIKARVEAYKLSRELKKATGKSHKVKISVDGGKGISGLLNGASSAAGAAGTGAGAGAGIASAGLTAGAMAGMAAMAAGVAAIAGGAMLTKSMINNGSELEQQKISMTHFLGGDQKKSDAYMKELRTNANLTPFSTSEVVSAGTRAVQIAEGDTKKGMEFVKLAEDMAALNPGKTISDAMEALADANMGEMERLKEFGFKGSKEAFDQSGGDLFKMKSNTGKSLMDMYQGGAEKLAGSHKGKLSTIAGNLQSGLADSGLKIIEALAPSLDKLIPISEKLAKKLPEITESVLKYAVPAFKTAGDIIKTYVVPVLKTLGSVIVTVASTIKSVIGGISDFGSGVKGVYGKAKKWFKGEGNATGTTSFGGGWTRMNERGDEMFQLPNRTKIYPSSKTDALLAKEIRQQGSSNKGASFVMNFNISTGGKVDERVLSKLVAREFEKVLVNIS